MSQQRKDKTVNIAPYFLLLAEAGMFCYRLCRWLKWNFECSAEANRCYLGILCNINGLYAFTQSDVLYVAFLLLYISVSNVVKQFKQFIQLKLCGFDTHREFKVVKSFSPQAVNP